MNDNLLIAKEVWASKEKAKNWLKRIERRKKTIKDSENTEIISIPVLLKDIATYPGEFKSILEIGAGNGRLIGAISEEFRDIKCYSCDINLELSRYVHDKHKRVSVVDESIDISKMPFSDNSFDLIYTYQVLQHVPPEDTEKALFELRRIAKKEFWLMEGYDPEVKQAGQKHGYKRKGTDGGSFSYFFEEVLDCYEVTVPGRYKGNEKGMGIKLYKIKV